MRTVSDNICSAIAVSVLMGLVAISLSGCGRSGPVTYAASGRVVYKDGSPVSSGTVTFRSEEGERPVTARAQIQPDGTFELMTFAPRDGAVPGRHKAAVSAPPPPPTENPRILRKPPPPLVDPIYSSFETSKLEFTVTDDPSKNQFKILVTK